MKLSDVVTNAFRYCAPYVTSTIALVDHARDDFYSKAGVLELQSLLGVSREEVLWVLNGHLGTGMNRLAHYYGFKPSEENEPNWWALPMSNQPFDDGPRTRWSARKIEYVRDVLTGDGTSRPSVRLLAWRMDTTEERIRDALRRRNIKLRSSR